MKILVIRRDNIGDLVCTTPLLHTLRQGLPHAHISVLVNSYNHDVLLGNPDINEIFSYEKLKHKTGVVGKTSAIFSRTGLLFRMRSRNFDLAILAKSGFDLHGLRMARWSGAKRILGFAPTSGEADSRLTDPIMAENLKSLHEVEVLAQLSRYIGIHTSPENLHLFPTATLKDIYHCKLNAKNPRKHWLALHLSAREKTRQWPAKKFIELIEKLARFPQLGFALFWSPGSEDNPKHPGDDDKAAEILRCTKLHPVVAINTVRLDELIAGIAVCNVFIGADGGAMHVAAGLGLPIVALFENSDFKRTHWHPWKVDHRLLQPSTFAVSDIEVDAVDRAVCSLLCIH